MPTVCRSDAIAIWQAGVDAVRSDRLVRSFVQESPTHLTIGTQSWPLVDLRQIVVVGAGKAVRGMGAGLEQAISPALASSKHLRGWLNVPADCAQPLHSLHVHAARPAGRNEPTREGQYGAEQILELVRSLGPQDLCICLLSGGGSALLPAPRDGVTLDDLLQITRTLSAAGANIFQLNQIRKRFSAIQGGQLARACRAGWLVTLILSDVIGDPLDIIASGPTLCDDTSSSSAQQALATWDEFDRRAPGQLPAALRHLLVHDAQSPDLSQPTARVTHHLLANNATAVQAAATEARRRGYLVEIAPTESETTTAEQVGTQLAERLLHQLHTSSDTSSLAPICVVSGGEPVVQLTDAAHRGRGGRNQQLALAALQRLASNLPEDHWNRCVLLSGGTDGEDGPTDAAGAIVDREVWQEMLRQRLDTVDALRRNDSYHFFQACGGLLVTGPTHTNVCDLRVGLAGCVTIPGTSPGP